MLLESLRSSTSWDEVAVRLSCSVPEARAQVQAYLASRVPPPAGELLTPLSGVRIVRDEWGVPHIFADDEAGAYHGLGFAMGQDRLWQLEYLRRLASGTLAEVLGAPWIESDRLYRTLDLRRVAAEVVAGYDAETRDRVEAFCGGINLARVQQERHGLPFECEFLECTPDSWTPEDTETVLRAFWWQLTGRFFFLSVPEQAQRLLGEGPLLEALLTPEGNASTIWPDGVPYPDLPRWEGGQPAVAGLQDSGETGSNNWVVGSRLSTSGAPLLASDPHVPLIMPSVWYEARLRAGDLDVCGAYGAGTPGLFFGRNPQVAWGLTNNISSLRDLYVEVTDDFDPERYRRGEHWQGMTRRSEVIQVRGGDPVSLEVREVDHGPVVTPLLPGWARTEQTVSLRWVGHTPTPETRVMLEYSRAGSVAEFRAKLADWACPTFNFVAADTAGEIAYQLTGKIPLRRHAARGYRPGDDPEHQWVGFIPYAALPTFTNPPDGWLGTANNPVVTDAWPYPLAGYWPSDGRMRRLRSFFTGATSVTPEQMAAGQFDDLAPRAVTWAARVVSLVRTAGVDDSLLAEIAQWDHRYPRESRPALVFETFFAHWCRTVLSRRLPPAMVSDMLIITAGLTTRTLGEDVGGWFGSEEARVAAAGECWRAALAFLTKRVGADRAGWEWGALHQVKAPLPVSDRYPLLNDLLQVGPLPNAGTLNTLNNSPWTIDRPFDTSSGVSYRLLVDLAGATLSVVPGGQSGHPGSPHYADQFPLWLEGRYHSLSLSDPWDGPAWVLRAES